MPIIAIPIAAVAIGVAADAAITAGLTIGTALAITAAVGATVGAIGAVTGNKELQIAGTVLGAVGGVGALANSAGLFAADALEAGTALDPGTFPSTSSIEGAGEGAAMAGTAGAGAAAPAASASTTDIVGAVSGNVAPSAVNPASTAAADVTPPAAVDTSAGEVPTGRTGSLLAPQNNATTDFQGGAQAPQAPSIPEQGGGEGGAPGMPNMPAPGAAAGGPMQPGAPASPGMINPGAGATPPPTVPDPAGDLANWSAAQNAPSTGSPSTWSNILDFAKTSGGGMALYGAIQAGASFLGGATNPLTPAQVGSLKAQADANQAQANQTNLQVANEQQPIPIANRNGLINRATGAPT